MLKIEVLPNRNILNIADYEEMSYSLSHGELFRDFCIKKNVPISLPFLGGQSWALELAKLGHIAVMEDSFGIVAFANYNLSREQRSKILLRKEYFKETDFSGVIVAGDGSLKNFDKELLQKSNDQVLQEFIEELTPKVVREKSLVKKGRF